MHVMRRAWLVVFSLTVPAILTALMYIGSKYLLYATSRTVDPKVFWYAAAVELPVFFFVAVLEVKDRW